jgi:hypothetical protein
MDFNEEPNQVRIDVVWEDQDLIQLQTRVIASGWSGIAKAYAVAEDILAFADSLEQFTRTLKSPASFVAGEENGIGFLSLRFYRYDRSGHIACHVRLASDSVTGGRPEEVFKLAIEVKTEAAAIDPFVRGLMKLAYERRGEAVLTIE